MKRLFILFGLFAALQLSAQNVGSDKNSQQQSLPENTDQAAMQMHNPHHSGMPGFGQPGSQEQPPAFHRNHDKQPFGDDLSGLSEKDRETVHGYLKELHKAVEQKENELQLRKAELRYLTHLDKPNLNQISGKLDEISKLNSTIQLETIKCRLKIKEQFPDFADKFITKPHHPNGKPAAEKGRRLQDSRK